MRPGRLSSVGFLGEDESLEAVLARDAETLSRLGLTFEALAQALHSVIQKALEQWGETVRIGQLEALIPAVSMGSQICPWVPNRPDLRCPFPEWVEHGFFDWILRDRATGEMMKGPGLIAHLIRFHHFFEGLESPYRVDPERLARMLDRVRD